MHLAIAAILLVGLAPALLSPAPPRDEGAADGAGASAVAAAEDARPLVSLGELRAHPGRWLGREFRAVMQFDAAREEAPIYLSRFGFRTHWPFAAWDDEQPLWEREAYEDPAPRLFAARGSASEVRLRAARRFERFEVEGTVIEVLLGEPWIEIHRVRRLEGSWNEGALVHATRAEALMRSARWYLAADQFERTLAGRLPEAARERVEALRDRCRELHARSEQIRRRGAGAFRHPR